MHIHYYDGSFEGVLSAIFDAYTSRNFPGALLRRGEIPPLHAASEHTVITDAAKSRRVFSGLERRISPEARKALMRAWFSEEPGCDFLIFQYLRVIFDTPEQRPLPYMNEYVRQVREAARRVSREAERLRGFARFQKTKQGVYFCAVSPRHNVIPLLIPYFRDRLGDQQWILYDAGRGHGIYYDTERLHEVCPDIPLLSGGRLEEALLADDESLFQNVWKGYYSATAIPERKNTRLQARCMPRRFWPYLTEKQ